MLSVKKIGHATFTTTDIELSIEYYTAMLGLSIVDRTKNRALLATAFGELAIVLEAGLEPACTGMSFHLAPDADIRDVETRLRRAGLPVQSASDALPGVAKRLSTNDPKGTRIELHAAAERLPRDLTPRGFEVLKLGHLAFKTPDIQSTVAFYRDVLGFRVSDWRGDFFVFMRCGPDHHTVNFASAATARMHHIAFELKDWAEVQRACDYLGRNNYQMIWGPGRHVIGDNIFTYHKNPDGQVIELYTELARMDDETLGAFAPRAWRQEPVYKPGVWGPETLGNLWGPPMPKGFAE